MALDLLLIAHAQRIGLVRPKRRNALEPKALIQPNGLHLVDTRLQPQQRQDANPPEQYNDQSKSNETQNTEAGRSPLEP